MSTTERQAEVSTLEVGDFVQVIGSYEGGKSLMYTGTVVAVKPSGTVLIDDAVATDGAGTPVRHYCSSGKVERITRARSPEKEVALARYREDLLSGRTLVLSAQSHRSRYGYMPPMGRRSYAHAMRTLANMAATSDRLAQVAAGIFGMVNLYGDDGQACAAIYEAASAVMSGKYDDVIGRAGPEAGRFSSHQHDWTLYDRVAVAYWLELACRPMAACGAGVGWCLALVGEEVGFVPTPEMTAR